MALVRDANGNLIDDGLGPNGRPAPIPVQGVPPTPLTGPRGPGVANPLGFSVAPGAGGPRGGGAIVTPVQPLAPVAPVVATAAAPVSPEVTPLVSGPSNFQVLQADRANLAAMLPPEQGPATTLPANVLAETNQRIAQTLASNRPDEGIYQPAQRGVYNQYNTNKATLAKPVGEGLNFGFGTGAGGSGETATEYLQRMRAQDQQDAVNANQLALSNEVMRLQSGITGDSTAGEVQAARSRLAVLQPLLAGQNQNQAATTNARIGADSQRSTSANQLAAAGITAQLGAQSRLAAADLTGQYGVNAASIKAQGQVDAAATKANTPEGQLAAQKAQLLATRLGRLNAKIAAGTATDQDYLDYTAATAQMPKQFIDPVTGAPLSPDEIAVLQQRNLSNLTQPR